MIFAIIGILISSKSLNEIERSNQQGKGLAIAGKVYSIVGLCLQVLLVLFLFMGLISFYSYE
ncbi:DUF4190 domain-containing protein [Neobacillus drentensis]|uniref:DUF4190 domain-containing protein n=1 Tax=Neobacillus drentensis TaxID=220684 RepID=UPI0030012819